MIPHPSFSELLISAEVFIALYVPKKILDQFINAEAKTIKKAIYKYHNKHHKTWLRFCEQDDCIKLGNSQRSHQSLAQVVATQEDLLT